MSGDTTDGMREEIARLKVQLARAVGQFRAADPERNALATKCNELGVQLDDERRARADAEARLSRAKAVSEDRDRFRNRVNELQGLLVALRLDAATAKDALCSLIERIDTYG